MKQAQWALPADDLGLVEPVDRLGQRIVVLSLSTDGTSPASASGLVHLIETYWGNNAPNT